MTEVTRDPSCPCLWAHPKGRAVIAPGWKQMTTGLISGYVGTPQFQCRPLKTAWAGEQVTAHAHKLEFHPQYPQRKEGRQPFLGAILSPPHPSSMTYTPPTRHTQYGGGGRLVAGDIRRAAQWVGTLAAKPDDLDSLRPTWWKELTSTGCPLTPICTPCPATK